MHLEDSRFLQKVFVLPRPSTLRNCGLSQTVKHLYIDVSDRSRIVRRDTFRADFPLWIFQPCANSLAIVDHLLLAQELQKLARSRIQGQIQRFYEWHQTWPILVCHLQCGFLSSQIWSDSGQPLFLSRLASKRLWAQFLHGKDSPIHRNRVMLPRLHPLSEAAHRFNLQHSRVLQRVRSLRIGVRYAAFCWSDLAFGGKAREQWKIDIPLTHSLHLLTELLLQCQNHSQESLLVLQI